MTFIESVKGDANKITLKKYGPPSPELLITDQNCINITFLDTETTGLDRVNDQIIEMAIKTVRLEESSGKIIAIEGSYESFNDPGEDISTEITLLTGIENHMVDGQSIDWEKVDSLLLKSDLIIAHNASFDRAFVDRHSSISSKKIWACSINDIDWLARGFTNTKQELLCYWHGFYFDAHRAMSDVDALINLLTFDSSEGDRTVVELIKNSLVPDYVVFAEHFKYDPIKKDILKSNKYRWNPSDKIWFKKVNFDVLEHEKDWLTATIYDQDFKGRVEQINPVDKYKLS